jgi:hypothetical protein
MYTFKNNVILQWGNAKLIHFMAIYRSCLDTIFITFHYVPLKKGSVTDTVYAIYHYCTVAVQFKAHS